MKSRRTHQALAETERSLLACIVLMAGAVALTAAAVYFLGALDLESFAWRRMEAPPIPEADRLVRVELPEGYSAERAGEWLMGQAVLEHVVLWRPCAGPLRDGGSVLGSFECAAVTPGFFEAVLVEPYLGRVLVEQDVSERLPAVVVGYELWDRWLGTDPGVIGRTVEVGEMEGVVVGVMPEGFSFPEGRQLWLPMSRRGALSGGSDTLADGAGSVQVFGKLKPGVTLEEAQAELDRLVERHPDLAGKVGQGLRLVPFFGGFANVELGPKSSTP